MSKISDSINRERMKDLKGHNELLIRDIKVDRLKATRKKKELEDEWWK